MHKDTAIIGHERQRADLEADLASGNIAHAYLFEGPAHVGKFTVARWFARLLLARGLLPERAEAVHGAMARLLHPDDLVLDQLWIEERCDDWGVIARSSNVPQEHRQKAGMRSDTISIDDVRCIQDRLHETGTGKHRCCTIRSVERMQEPAANALLKILEEPPPGRVFLLTTQSIGSLPPPVVSRARVLRFRRLPAKAMTPLVAGLPDDDAQFLLHLAEGAPGRLQTLRGDPDALLRERQAHAQAAALWQARPAETLKLLAPLRERGPDADRFLLHIAMTLREVRGRPPHWAVAFDDLARGLATNAQRDLLLQRFALSKGGA